MIKISIEYCNKCKWQFRALWYLQELLQTFDGKINEISLIPNDDTPGTFIVRLGDGDKSKILYKKRMKKSTLPQAESYVYDGFPDSKFLKVLVRNEISPDENLGHIDKYENYGLTEKGRKGGTEKGEKEEKVLGTDTQKDTEECRDCKIEQ